MYQKRDWTDRELRAAGFVPYARRKQLLMARCVTPDEAPLAIKTDQGDTLTATAGYYLVYDPNDSVRGRIDEYNHWPVAPQIFEKAYGQWDEPLPDPTPAEQHLLDNGCKPYYKAVGVWAKAIEQDTYVQSMEHQRPVLVLRGRVVAIGQEGEPYHMSQDSFLRRYTLRETLMLRIGRWWRMLRDYFKS